MPVEMLRQLREGNGLEQALVEIKENPDDFNRFVDLMGKARETTPVFNASKTVATFHIREKEPVDNAGANPAAAPAKPLTTNVKLSGFGADLYAVIGRSLAALEEGDIATFVANVFPAGELRRPEADKHRAQLVSHLKANPAPVQQMIADLKAIQGEKPAYEDSGNVAAFQIAGGTIEAGRKTITLPTRTFKFQKVENSWRLYDNTSRTRAEVARQSKLKLAKFTPRGGQSVIFEKLGDSWRILRFNY